MKRNLKQMCLCLLIAGVSGLFVSCDDYDPGDIVPTYRNLVVTYESNGGSAVEPCTVDEEGDFSPVPASPVKSGYVFDGWYADEALTEEFDPVNERIYRDMTVYAKYVTEEENALRFNFDANQNTLGALKDEYKETVKYLSLPASVNGVPAYHVTAWAFYQNEHILTLTVPEGYKTIQDNACDGASGLRIVRLPSTLERLGSRTFALCANLETIDLGGLKEFVQHTFFGCVKVKTLRIPGSCKVFPTQGFYQSLADEIILEEGVTQLADLALHEASAGRVVVPASMQTVGTNAFAYFNFHYPGAFILQLCSRDPESVALSTNGCFMGSTPIIEVPADAVAAYNNSPAWSGLGFEIRAAN